MSNLAQWQQLLPTLRERFVGGDIEQQANPEGVFRGPISEITLDGGTLTISVPWCAHLESDGWVKWGTASASYTLEFCSAPQDLGDGRLEFNVPFGFVTLFPRDGSKLDPKKVRGL